MISFLLNDQTITTDELSGTTLLDFVRYHKNLTGTKIGCREGDCGACTLLVGEIRDDGMYYQSLTSCITPIGNIHGKHVVTIEGLNMKKLSPVQQCMVDESGTQCGFCTVGFVMSMTGACLQKNELTRDNMLIAIDGNICRCTGYKSIERASFSLLDKLNSRDQHNPMSWLVENDFIPGYFLDVPEKLSHLPTAKLDIGELIIGGGTDLYVQKHHETEESLLHFTLPSPEWKGVRIQENFCVIGGASTVSNLMDSFELRAAFPSLNKFFQLISSTPIRNIGTIAGNFVNASPIGDLSSIFLALDAEIVLKDEVTERKIRLRDFFLSYKKLDKAKDEMITQIIFPLPDKNTFFNFEKVSKRTYLDIASVNTACCICVEEGVVQYAHFSAGGVAPIPLYLIKSTEFLKGKTLSIEVVHAFLAIVQTEISPISDARGSEDYKRLLLNQLVFAHFVELFPQLDSREVGL